MGVDYLVTPTLLLGVGAQFDWTTMEIPGSANLKGTGFMVGPYATARLADGLFADARLAWGFSKNSIVPVGLVKDDFNGERWLASVGLVGQFHHNMFLIRPEARVSWFTEMTTAYRDSLGSVIPSARATTAQIELGPKISTSLELTSGATFTPFVDLKGIWGATTVTGRTLDDLPQDGVRGKAAAGFSLGHPNGFRLSAEGFVDGLGSSGYGAYGLKVGLSGAF